MNIFDSVGFWGPVILNIMALFQLWKRSAYLYGYVIFILLNSLLNNVLKILIKEPRPADYNKYDDPGNYTAMQKYGMPSGHSQSVIFTTTYLWLATQSVYLLFTGLFISMLTLYQRWKFKKHTIAQLMAGALVGSGFAYFATYIIKKYLATKYGM